MSHLALYVCFSLLLSIFHPFYLASAHITWSLYELILHTKGLLRQIILNLYYASFNIITCKKVVIFGEEISVYFINY